jgi:hypothetical protein
VAFGVVVTCDRLSPWPTRPRVPPIRSTCWLSSCWLAWPIGCPAAVKRSYVQGVFQRLGTTAHDLRVDRLLAEVHAGGGDPLTLTGLFGISDPTAIRLPLPHRTGPARAGDRP